MKKVIIRKILAQNKMISFSFVACASSIVSTNNTDGDSTEGYNSTTSRHEQIRYEADESYMQSISKRQQRYNEKIKLRKAHFETRLRFHFSIAKERFLKVALEDYLW